MPKEILSIVKGIKTMNADKIIEEILKRRKQAVIMAEEYTGQESDRWHWWDGYWQALNDLQMWIETEGEK